MLQKCKCGCGQEFEDKDQYGRTRQYINGHNGRKYKGKNDYRKEWVKRNRSSVNTARQARVKRLKIRLMEELTDCKCSVCGLGYDGKNGAVFQFHHTDPDEKEFQIGRALINKAWEAVVEEASKCVLVCSNCHHVIHRGEY